MPAIVGPVGRGDLQYTALRKTAAHHAAGKIGAVSAEIVAFASQDRKPGARRAQIRAALKYISPERLVISSDCGMGREGMSRRHAYYKMVSLVLGTDTVRKELGRRDAECLAAEERYSLVVPAR